MRDFNWEIWQQRYVSAAFERRGLARVTEICLSNSKCDIALFWAGDDSPSKSRTHKT